MNKSNRRFEAVPIAEVLKNTVDVEAKKTLGVEAKKVAEKHATKDEPYAVRVRAEHRSSGRGGSHS